MKQVFISQPMIDKTDEEIMLERDNAVSAVSVALGGEAVEIIDSFFRGAPHDANPLWFLSRSLELLSMADVAYFCAGWENYRGCKIEHECAEAYGILTIDA